MKKIKTLSTGIIAFAILVPAASALAEGVSVDSCAPRFDPSDIASPRTSNILTLTRERYEDNTDLTSRWRETIDLFKLTTAYEPVGGSMHIGISYFDGEYSDKCSVISLDTGEGWTDIWLSESRIEGQVYRFENGDPRFVVLVPAVRYDPDTLARGLTVDVVSIIYNPELGTVTATTAPPD
ncbi:hypothetical protein [Jannaschia sp. M317]|uniref:hypothetical protein n=1 Tax=Jannaschia sp. M317 TaxID=2867011 RepID=UPI0021A5BDB6|nr:hypothetical protein [Jannaschia sp. M317]UWQ19224.1 hypothetical protein K3551_08140 [Jannaschia sp. M317]